MTHLETRAEAMHNISVDIVKRYGNQFGFLLIMVDIATEDTGHTSNMEQVSQLYALLGAAKTIAAGEPDSITVVDIQPS